MRMTKSSSGRRIRGVCQNNFKNLDLDIHQQARGIAAPLLVDRKATATGRKGDNFFAHKLGLHQDKIFTVD